MINIFSIKKMKFLLLLLTIIFLFSWSPQIPKSALGSPFGGKITWYIPNCNYNTAWLVYLQPPPAPLPYQVMYLPWLGTSYNYLPPYRIGQNLLGAVSAPIVCIIGSCPFCVIVGAGPTIMYQGGSF